MLNGVVFPSLLPICGTVQRADPENAASVCKRSVQLDGGFQEPKGKKSRKNLHGVRVLSDFLFRFFSLGDGSQDGNSK